jgi:predicted aspartyl protease
MVRVSASLHGTADVFRDVDFLVDERVRWMVLPSAVCGELGIETPGVDSVVVPSGETVDCEFGSALIETAGSQGATLVYRFDGTEPKIGNIALGSLGIRVDKQTGELVMDTQPIVKGFWPK